LNLEPGNQDSLSGKMDSWIPGLQIKSCAVCFAFPVTNAAAEWGEVWVLVGTVALAWVEALE
jgi:hypothetical protein